MAMTSRDFETIDALTLQHRAFDPFIRAEIAERSVALDLTGFILSSVEDGFIDSSDVSFEDMNEID